MLNEKLDRMLDSAYELRVEITDTMRELWEMKTIIRKLEQELESKPEIRSWNPGNICGYFYCGLNRTHPVHVRDSNIGSYHGFVPLRTVWKELERFRYLDSLLFDLNRCQHGRHKNDSCNECGGISRGNPHAGRAMGYDIGGNQVTPEMMAKDRQDLARD